MKYVYPAVFHAEPEGGYTIFFPDIEGCLSQEKRFRNAARWQKMH